MAASRDIMQEVARFADVYQAEVAAAFLVAHGVDAIVAERLVATINPILQTALGGVRVLAPSEQADEAKDLLARAYRGEFAEGAADAATEPHAGPLFPVMTAAAGLMLGEGYAGRAFVGARGGLSAVQRVGMVLLAVMVMGWAAMFLIHVLGGR